MPEQNISGTGYLIIQVTTANGAIPIAGASVAISGNTPQSADAFWESITDIDGRTERIALPTVPRAESEQPGNPQPYLTYNIEVRAPRYRAALFTGAPIFDGITAFQTADLSPLPENGYTDGFSVEPPLIFETPRNTL